MKRLKQVQKNAMTCDLCRTFHCWFWLISPWWAWPSVPWLAIMMIPWSTCDPFQTAMHRFLRDFNRVLEPKGVYVKAFCFKHTANKGGFWKDGTLATLTFGLNPDAIQRVKTQPVLQEGNPVEGYLAKIFFDVPYCWRLPGHAQRAV